jgi:hypothetical protein
VPHIPPSKVAPGQGNNDRAPGVAQHNRARRVFRAQRETDAAKVTLLEAEYRSPSAGAQLDRRFAA